MRTSLRIVVGNWQSLAMLDAVRELLSRFSV